MPNCAGFFRRSLFSKIGGLDESLHFGMDYEFYLRARQLVAVLTRPQVLGCICLHDMSKSVRSSALQRLDAETIATRYQRGSRGRQRRKP